MKTTNNLFSVNPLWQVYIIMSLFFTAVSFFSVKYIFILESKPVDLLETAFIISLITSSMFTFYIHSIRKNVLFFNDVKRIDKLINECNTKSELDYLYNLYTDLFKYSTTNIRNGEINRLRDKIQPLYRTIK